MMDKARDLLEFTEHLAKFLLTTYLIRDSGSGVPMISIDGAAAKRDLEKVKQGTKGVTLPMIPASTSCAPSWRESTKTPKTAQSCQHTTII